MEWKPNFEGEIIKGQRSMESFSRKEEFHRRKIVALGFLSLRNRRQRRARIMLSTSYSDKGTSLQEEKAYPNS